MLLQSLVFPILVQSLFPRHLWNRITRPTRWSRVVMRSVALDCIKWPSPTSLSGSSTFLSSSSTCAPTSITTMSVPQAYHSKSLPSSNLTETTIHRKVQALQEKASTFTSLSTTTMSVPKSSRPNIPPGSKHIKMKKCTKLKKEQLINPLLWIPLKLHQLSWHWRSLDRNESNSRGNASDSHRSESKIYSEYQETSWSLHEFNEYSNFKNLCKICTHWRPHQDAVTLYDDLLSSYPLFVSSTPYPLSYPSDQKCSQSCVFWETSHAFHFQGKPKSHKLRQR